MLITVTLVVACLAALSLTRIQADVALLGTLTLMLLLGVIEPERAAAGFANTGVLTLAALFPVVAALRQTGVVDAIARRALSFTDSESRARWRMMLAVASCSAFINNTPLVAITTPMIRDWAIKVKLSPSRLLLPLSYAAIAGGTLTLLGSSVNLALAGIVYDASQGQTQLTLWDPVWFGLPICAAVLLYCALFAPKLLAAQTAAATSERKTSLVEYNLSFIVESNGILVGQSVEAAGLRHLRGMYLAEIQRGETLITAVEPSQTLQANDQLHFVGNTDDVGDLIQMSGLRPAEDQINKLETPRHQRQLIEAVVANGSNLVGRSIRSAKIRTRFGAVVLAVFRQGEALKGQKIGDIQIKAGDLFLMEANAHAQQHIKASRDFLMASLQNQQVAFNQQKRPLAITIFVALIAAASAGLADLMTLAWLSAGLMLLSRCITAKAARDSIDWQLLLVLAAAIGMGNALVDSGAINALTDLLTAQNYNAPALWFALLFAVTALTSAFVTNSAAVVILFPLAQALALQTGVELKIMALLLLAGASASFMTPMAYQTNLLVYNAGGYRFRDYLIFGLPLTVLVGAVAVSVAVIWSGA